MNEKAKEARREANRRYREAHKDELNAYRRKWVKENPEKAAAQRERYWTKKAKELELERSNA